MTKIVFSHLYHISFDYYDALKKENTSTFLINPYDSEEYINPQDVKEIYLNQDSFSKMITQRLEKYPSHKGEGYTKDSWELTDIKVQYKGLVRWWLKWFSHKTKSQFESESEAFSDFENYLEEQDSSYVGMGAEDRWRWKLCRCDDCINNNQTIITH